MSPKRKVIVMTSSSLVVALVCAGVAWSASDTGGLLGLTFKILAVLFVLASIAAAASCIGFARASSEIFAKPASGSKRSSSSTQRELPANFEMPIPDAAPKKQPRPAKKPASVPNLPPSNGKKPRPATRPAPEASAE